MSRPPRPIRALGQATLTHTASVSNGFRVAQIICSGLYPEALANGKTLADFPHSTRENLLAIAEAILSNVEEVVDVVA